MALIWLLSTAALMPGLPVGSATQDADHDSWGMAVVTNLFCRPYLSVPCADADRDGQREFYASVYVGPDSWAACAFEHIGNNQFDTFWLAPANTVCPEGIGDADGDGLTDLVLHGLLVFESPDSFSLPTDSVWGAGLCQSEHFYPAIADIDADSARDLVMFWESVGICVFECVGDNQYAYRYHVPPPSDGYVAVQTQDLDRNGLPEIAVRAGGCIAFFEAVGDDSIEFKDTVRILDSDVSRCYALAAMPDLDRDGRNELLVPFLARGQNLFKVAVVEWPCAGSPEVVWADSIQGGSWDAWSVAVGDIDGDSVLEFMVTNGVYVRLYRCTGSNRYECFWQTDSGGERATLHDINSDGRDELICDYQDRTLIWEWLPVGVEERARVALERVTVLPSVARRSEVVRIAGLPQSAVCEVADASGRIVARPASGVWRPASSTAGTYFLRIRLGNQAVVRKVLVVE